MIVRSIEHSVLEFYMIELFKNWATLADGI
jgi:hypothetical protein